MQMFAEAMNMNETGERDYIEWGERRSRAESTGTSVFKDPDVDPERSL